ncbi:DUF1842 domain-containing protein [Rhizobium sp. CSW-27]|uniref:DUF1842 domain-containing protein n=1 Tax=Rhizobium sp. CSW-27 TaxID=2839985 RepID=UPI001C02C484|nr:DUF1842 domain-containing protein [Rhizobium sp. CSW-27]MBT9372535.1 DUF1842 domain-containing protein [Rhizobium sp. CSW-27]
MAIEGVQKTGLFFLPLRTEGALGAPVNTLSLTVYTPKSIVTGHSEVTQAVNPPLNVSSHVTGTLIYETVMGPGSKVRIDLTGWPEINWPAGAGVGPVIPENYSAIIVLEPDFSSGEIIYQYRTGLTGEWHQVRQKIVRNEAGQESLSKAA